MGIVVKTRINGMDGETEISSLLDKAFGATPGLSIVRGVTGWQTNPPGVSGNSPVVTDVDGATITFDLSVSVNHTVTLGGNRTLALSNPSIGQEFMIVLLQDGSGSRTVTWFGGIKWSGASVPTLTTTAAKYDAFGFLTLASGVYLNVSSTLNL